jgi:hypothetical protein
MGRADALTRDHATRPVELAAAIEGQSAELAAIAVDPGAFQPVGQPRSKPGWLSYAEGIESKELQTPKLFQYSRRAAPRTDL